MKHCAVYSETKFSCNSTILNFQTAFQHLTHWEDNNAILRHFRSDFSQGKDVRFIPLPVCFARSIGLKIVQSVRLSGFLPKHEAC